jgi:hypothetical protein
MSAGFCVGINLARQISEESGYSRPKKWMARRPIVIQHITNINRHKDPPKDHWDLLAQLL